MCKEIRAYDRESEPIAGDTILRYELNDRILPDRMVVTGVERALIKRGMENGGRKVICEAAQLHVSEVDAIVENHTKLLELPVHTAADRSTQTRA